MSASSCTSPAAGGGFTVVTHISPTTPSTTGVQRGSFSRKPTLALGTVQIMVGLMVFLMGLSSVVTGDSFAVYSGVFVWGAASYVAAGSVSVAAASSTNRCLVSGVLATNIVAAMFSCIATIMYSLDAAGVLIYCYGYDCSQYRSRAQGMAGVLAVFNLLELIISISVAGFACNTRCCSAEPPPQQVIIYSNNEAGNSAAAQAPPYLQAPPTLQAPPAPQLNAQTEKPPEYSQS